MTFRVTTHGKVTPLTDPLRTLLARVGEVQADTLPGWDEVLRVARDGHSVRFALERRRGAAGRSAVDAFLARSVPTGVVGVLAAAEIPASARERIRAAGRGYVDEAGNAYLSAGPVLVHIDGLSTVRRARTPGLRGAGLRVLGAFLAEPELLSSSLRVVAEACGVSTKAVRSVRARLEDQGQLVTSSGRQVLADPSTVLDEWLAGYRDILRPALVVGRYYLPHEDPVALERLLDHRGADWAWGGSRGAAIQLGTTVGPDVVLHLTERPPDFLRPTEDGRMEVLDVPAPPLGRGDTHGVHPILCLAELAVRQDPRSREIAADLREALAL